MILRYKEDALRSLFEVPKPAAHSDLSLSGKTATLDYSVEKADSAFSSDDDSIEDMPLMKEAPTKKAGTLPPTVLEKRPQNVDDVSILSSLSTEKESVVLRGPRKEAKTVPSIAPLKESKGISWRWLFLHTLIVALLAMAFYFLYPVLQERKEEFLQYILLV